MDDKDLEKLVFGMAHQIRNPCAIILSNARLLAQLPGLKPEARRSIESIINGAKYLESRLDEFVEFSKPLRPNWKPVSVSKLLGQAAAMFKEKCQLKRTAISSKVENGLVIPKGDYDLLLLAVLNVVLNAVEAIPEYGKIEIESFRDSQAVQIAVRDSGAGIHPRDLPEVFSPFYSTKQGGVGIGLAVAKRILEAHRGSIELQSQQGKGTQVVLRLPAKDDPPTSP